MKYISRLIDKKITAKLKTSGAVLITGPKFCGKTTTCKQHAKTIHSFSTKKNIDLYSIDYRSALIGETPVLIDEWQNIPEIWDEIREDVDNRGETGQFLLTGSISKLNHDEIIHSGVGRFSRIVMYPFSLYESNESNGLVSIKELFENKEYKIFNPTPNGSLSDVAFYICRGGWPTAINIEKEYALDVSANYLDGVINYKSKDEKNYFPRPKIAELLVKSYARHISTQASLTTIMKDIKENNNTTMDDETFSNYLEKLYSLFIIEDIQSWNPNLRSKATIRTTPTRHFIDSSIATQALGISPNDLLNDLNSFGLFFEDMCIRDLKVYSDAIGGKVYHYRDSDNLEIDAVIHLKNGKWGAFEIKLGGEKLINEGIKSLKKLYNKIDYSKFNTPEFLAVITATGPCYKTKDGIYIIPITMLKD